MASRSPLHSKLVRLRDDLRAGTVPTAPSEFLGRTAQIWEEIDRIARAPIPNHDIIHVCCLVSDCVAGMIQARQRVAGLLDALAKSPDADFERIDRALAGFSGLDSSDFFRACFLALSIEAERAFAFGPLIPQEIAQKVADAIEQNLGGEISLQPDKEWMSFVFSHTPLDEGLRMVRFLRVKNDDLLRKLHAKEPEDFLCASPTRANAKQVVQKLGREALRAWVDTLQEDETKDNIRSALVSSLVEDDRLDEAFEFSEEVVSERFRVNAAQNGLEACLGQGREEEAHKFLSMLPLGDATLEGRVTFVRARLYQVDELEAAAEEMNRIQEDLAQSCGGNLREWRTLSDSELGYSITVRSMRTLAEGWATVFYTQLQLGDFKAALKTAERVHYLRMQAGLLANALAGVQRKLSLTDALYVAHEAVRIAEESNSTEHGLQVVSYVIEFLAREGSSVALDAAWTLIAEKFEAADASVRERHFQSALNIFVSCPPRDVSLEESADLARRIRDPKERVTSLRALAIHAALEGSWELSRRLMRRANRVEKQIPPEAQHQSNFLDESSEGDAKPSVSQFLRWLKGGTNVVQGDSDSHYWFNETFELAKSLQECALEAVYGVARLLIESRPFTGQTKLYQSVLEEIETPFKYRRAAFFYTSELRRRIVESPSSPVLEALEEVHWKIERNPPSEDTAPTNLHTPPHQRVIQKHFQKMLDSLRGERIPTSFGFVSSFLGLAVQRILHPIDRKVVDALFAAGSGMNWATSLGEFAFLMHKQALRYGGTPEARRVASEARSFAERTDCLERYEELLSEEPQIKDGALPGKPRPRVEQRIKGLEFEAGFSLASQQSASVRMQCTTQLFEKALAIGDRDLFLKVFEFAESAFCSICAEGGQEIHLQYAIPWFKLLGRFPNITERLQLLRRIWDWFSSLERIDLEEMVVHWAGQMAAAGQTERAIQEIENLRYADRQAQGFMEIALACGLMSDEESAVKVFGRFLDVLKCTNTLDHCSVGFSEAVERGCMECVRAGNDARLFEIIEAVKNMFLKKVDFFLSQTATGVARYAFGVILSVLAAAGRTDKWESFLEDLLQSKMVTHWSCSEFSYLIDQILEGRPGNRPSFTQDQRLSFLDKFFEMAQRANVTLGTTEARALLLCLQGSENPWEIIERFEALSDCSPEVVSALLERDPNSPEQRRILPETSIEPILGWIASLCPYSDISALAYVEHVAARCLERNDWVSLKTLAVECSFIDLIWLEKLADAVLNSASHRPRFGT